MRVVVVNSDLRLYGKIIAKIQKFCLLPIKNVVNFLKLIMWVFCEYFFCFKCELLPVKSFFFCYYCVILHIEIENCSEREKRKYIVFD